MDDLNVGYALIEFLKYCLRHLGKHVVTHAHRFVTENPQIHDFQARTDRWAEIHQGQNVALEVDSGSYFDEFQPAIDQAEYTALGNVQYRLFALKRIHR